ncbi:MAG: response regulator [Elusimicrobia bacterium]|nr:response regulator [Elusimicrobiota bacterium]
MADKKRILVVDDASSFLDLALEVFGGDYLVDTAPDGETGLKKALETVPDLILLDVNMPGMTGIEFARKLTANPGTARIPIIVITASDYNSLTQRLLQNEHNVKYFLTKLSPVETLKEKVLAVLDKKTG